jgi:hypothetical protein
MFSVLLQFEQIGWQLIIHGDQICLKFTVRVTFCNYLAFIQTENFPVLLL